MMRVMPAERSSHARDSIAIGVVHMNLRTAKPAVRPGAKPRPPAPLSNIVILQALPCIAETSSASGYMLESLFPAVTQADENVMIRGWDFLKKRAAKYSSSGIGFPDMLHMACGKSPFME